MLGSGWAAIPFIKGLSAEACQQKYDITVVSPRNYFLYSPLLPGALLVPRLQMLSQLALGLNAP